jgi:hypothetical protein
MFLFCMLIVLNKLNLAEQMHTFGLYVRFMRNSSSLGVASWELQSASYESLWLFGTVPIVKHRPVKKSPAD